MRKITYAAYIRSPAGNRKFLEGDFETEDEGFAWVDENYPNWEYIDGEGCVYQIEIDEE